MPSNSQLGSPGYRTGIESSLSLTWIKKDRENRKKDENFSHLMINLNISRPVATFLIFKRQMFVALRGTMSSCSAPVELKYIHLKWLSHLNGLIR